MQDLFPTARRQAYAEQLGNKVVRTAADYQSFRTICRIVCLVCFRERIVEGAVINQWFARPFPIPEAEKKLRCKKCGCRKTKLSPGPI